MTQFTLQLHWPVLAHLVHISFSLCAACWWLFDWNILLVEAPKSFPRALSSQIEANLIAVLVSSFMIVTVLLWKCCSQMTPVSTQCVSKGKKEIEKCVCVCSRLGARFCYSLTQRMCLPSSRSVGSNHGGSKALEEIRRSGSSRSRSRHINTWGKQTQHSITVCNTHTYTLA